MLSRPHRFSLKTERQRIESVAMTKSTPLFTALIAPSLVGPDAPLRFALLVSKKFSPLAVLRHRTKRQISAVIRPLLPQLPRGLDVILIPKKQISQATRDEMGQSIKKLLGQ